MTRPIGAWPPRAVWAGAVVVVGVQPLWQRGGALLAAGQDAGVSPLGEQRAVEPLDLANGLRPVRPRPLVHDAGPLHGALPLRAQVLLTAAAVCPPPAAVTQPPELLDVEVHQLARPVPLVPHRTARRPVQPSQPRHVVPGASWPRTLRRVL